MNIMIEKLPPKTVLTFQVGVTGHRKFTEEEKNILSDKVGEVLNKIAEYVIEAHKSVFALYAEDISPVLRIISPIAEGADRIIIERALAIKKTDIKISYQCPLPFHRDEYEKDFKSESSKEEFEILLSNAESVLELGGKREHAEEAYLNAGRIVLEQSDILIAIWNGEHPKLIGGTSHIVHEADKRGIPIIWLNSREPYNVKFGIDKNNLSWESELKKRIEHIINPFSFEEVKKKDSFETSVEAYLCEKEKRFNFAFAYQLLINLVGRKRLKLPSIKIPDYETYEEKQWLQDLKGGIGESGSEFTLEMKDASMYYCRHYAWADMLSVHYGNLYRTSYIIRYLFSVLAVIALALGFYAGTVQTNFLGFLFQGIFLGAIIFLAKFEHKCGWQKRFLDYRILAELIRQMRFLAPLGLVTPLIKVPVYNQNKSITWINWHFRAVAREKGLAKLIIDDKYLEHYFKLFEKAAVDSERNFYKNRWEEFDNISKRLSKIGMFIFQLGFCAVLIRAVPFVYKLYNGETEGVKAAIKFLNELSLVLPGFAPFFFSIKSQGEFERVSRRYKAMYQRLNDMSQEIKQLKYSEITVVGDIAKDFSHVMIREVSDWFELINARSISYV